MPIGVHNLKEMLEKDRAIAKMPNELLQQYSSQRSAETTHSLSLEVSEESEALYQTDVSAEEVS